MKASILDLRRRMKDIIEIRRILNVSQGTIRIAKDPRDNTLYTLRQNGAIDRIDLAAAERVPAYSHSDHGEVQDGKGAFPDLRETTLTAVVLRVPTDARELVLPNNRDALRAQGFLFAEGLRSAYDLAFAPNGDLFATENGPGRDMAEELNWLRQGHHYGFPWRMGLEDTPQQFPDYDPASDFLLPTGFTAVREGISRGAKARQANFSGSN